LAAILLALYGALTLNDAIRAWTTSSFHCPPPSATPTACVTLGSGPSGAWLSFALGVISLAAGAFLLVLFRRLERRRQAGPPKAG
jgi:hypothetical protein